MNRPFGAAHDQIRQPAEMDSLEPVEEGAALLTDDIVQHRCGCTKRESQDNCQHHICRNHVWTARDFLGQWHIGEK